MPKKKGESLNNKSKKEMEARGFRVETVEHKVPGTFITRDHWGFADVEAFGKGQFILVQVTSRNHLSDRRKKVLASEEARAWVENGGVILLHGWDEVGEGRKKSWRLKEESISAETFPCDPSP